MTEKERRQKIGARLASLRAKLETTQKDVGDQMGLSRQAIASWELGQSMPSITQLGQLAILYGTTTDYIVFGVETIPLALLGDSARKIKGAMDGYQALMRTIYRREGS